MKSRLGISEGLAQVTDDMHSLRGGIQLLFGKHSLQMMPRVKKGKIRLQPYFLKFRAQARLLFSLCSPQSSPIGPVSCPSNRPMSLSVYIDGNTTDRLNAIDKLVASNPAY